LYEQSAKLTDSAVPAPFVALANPIYTPVSAPERRGLGQEPIRKFLRDRAVYLRRLEERKKEPGCDFLTPVSLVTSIDPDLLEGLILTGELPEECTTLKDIEDTHVSVWLAKNTKKDSVALNVTVR
jgi:hypothetical protein